ncbi:DUF3014 domain-containing protein [Piscinibacter sp. XHJ-5]|uniref:DUF3014 domain-containing protein n=1 Tax=Piscinibacter sp. XHJ-5 TaxID=3037797 RepID=UPI0024528F13|nr:DUF3014 domain-containing protein [Piscinibacter sp. XHJ-5]
MQQPIEHEPLVADGPRSLARGRAARSRSANQALILGAVAVLFALGYLSWWYWHGTQPPPRTEIERPVAGAVMPAVPPPAASAPVAIQHPIEPATEETAPVTLPLLTESDPFMAQALAQLVRAPKARAMLQTDSIVRRFVATVDNLGRAHASAQLWPVQPTPGRFTVRTQGEVAVIDADNGLRYAPFVLLVESVDVARASAMYRSAYPLFQRAYEDLGYPNGYFNDRLVAVIDHLLAAPEPATPPAVRLLEVQGPVQLTRPWVHYEFVDPKLEAMSAGQKLLVRMGPVNERRLKARLAALRAAIAKS